MAFQPDRPWLMRVAVGPCKTQTRLPKTLRRGSIVSTTSVRVDDVIDPTKTGVAPLAVLTDGEWVWPADLAYYVEAHGCALPHELLDPMRALNWQPKALDADELRRVGQELRALVG